MTKITGDNEGPYPSDSAPTDGTLVTDASSTSSTKSVLAQLSNAMVHLTTEMSQLRHEHQTLQQPQRVPQPPFTPQYYPPVQSYWTNIPTPMTHRHPNLFTPLDTKVITVPLDIFEGNKYYVHTYECTEFT